MHLSTRYGKKMSLLFSSLFCLLEATKVQTDVDMSIIEHKVELLLYSWTKEKQERGASVLWGIQMQQK